MNIHPLNIKKNRNLDNPNPDYKKTYDAIIQYISERKAQIYEMLRIDKAIKADTYDNVARLREVQKIEKLLKKQK